MWSLPIVLRIIYVEIYFTRKKETRMSANHKRKDKMKKEYFCLIKEDTLFFVFPR